MNGDDREISLLHDEETWCRLSIRQRSDRCLRFLCCDGDVVLKTSQLGTRYFAHKARGACSSPPESAEHLLVKSLICKAVEDAGWLAVPEHRFAEGDDLCIADVLAIPPEGGAGIVFEVQCSPQSERVTVERTDRYQKLGVTTVWLMKQDAIPVSKSYAAVWLDFSEDVHVLLPGESAVSEIGVSGKLPSYARSMYSMTKHSVSSFVSAVLEARFRFGRPLDGTADLTVHLARANCDGCGNPMRPVCGLSLQYKGAGSKFDFMSKSIDLLDPNIICDKGTLEYVLDHCLEEIALPRLVDYWCEREQRRMLTSPCSCGRAFGNTFRKGARPRSSVTSVVPVSHHRGPHYWHIDPSNPFTPP